MKVTASALAISCLIEAIIETPEVSDVVEDQLNALGTDLDWLASLGVRYRKYWAQTFEYEAAGQTATVHENTVMLLSWLMSSVKDSELNETINSKTFSSTTQAYIELSGKTELPKAERITVTVGIIGRPESVIDRNYPVWFSGGFIDSNVELAYLGLLEHVAHAPDQEWPEVYRTAVLWRLGGIAQGLGGDGDLWDCLKELNKQLSGALPLAYRRMTGDEWISAYRKNRNVFTHVRTDSGQSFALALSEHEEKTQLLDYIRLSTYYAAVAINQGISSLEPKTVQRWLDVVDNDQAWVMSVG